MQMVVSILVGAGIVSLLALLGIVCRYAWITRPRRPSDEGYEYVMVVDDGSAREVTESEREYLETEFSPGDGARPYIKFRYESLDGWGSISGFLLRRQLPSRIKIRQPTEQEEWYSGG